ncbi:hypothetical protein KC957_02895 [Candidatus Saccharibacteria bacterium]|nr:hypothetical protein [Candidatus Saccharibacteria bacterium]
MINPELATAKLQSQFTRTPDFITEQSHRLPEKPRTREEIITDITALVATTFTMSIDGEVPSTPGQEFQQLVTWNHWLRSTCSDRYAQLSDPSLYDCEGLGKEALNRNPDLLMLNAIRRGVKKAMKRSQHEAERWGKLTVRVAS